MNKILVLHFTHPEGYPPALNAINCLSERADQLKVISIDTLPTRWGYNGNIELILLEGEHDRFRFVQRSKWQKVKTYFSYVKQIRKQLKANKPDLVLVYDNVPFLLYLFARLFIKKKHRLWYHNHDIYPLGHYPKFSINWFAFIAIQKYFNKIDFFSIPSKEREKMFPIQDFKGKSFFIPNYPSKKIIKADLKGQENWKESKFLKIIYPGSPSNKNGFEELINVMTQTINGKTVTLTIVGETNEKYKNELADYAKSKGVAYQLFFEKRVPYTEMSTFLSNYHIGWSMYKPKDMRTATVATASNKIYEFLANAMPIIVFDNEHHRKHLSTTSSTFFTDLSISSLERILTNIEEDYIRLSAEAFNEFEHKYQFEQHFNRVMDEIYEDLN